jgi:hypothetical protein
MVIRSALLKLGSLGGVCCAKTHAEREHPARKGVIVTYLSAVKTDPQI